MQQDSEIYVGLDTSKLKISVALAEAQGCSTLSTELPLE
jgi:hypothetical protein